MCNLIKKIVHTQGINHRITEWFFRSGLTIMNYHSEWSRMIMPLSQMAWTKMASRVRTYAHYVPKQSVAKYFKTICSTITLGYFVYRKRTGQFLNTTSQMVDFYLYCLETKMVVSQELVSLLLLIAGAVLSVFVLNLVAKPPWNFEFLVGKW